MDVSLPRIRNAGRQAYAAGITLEEAREEFDRAYLLAALEYSRWNESRTADHLGMHRNTLSRLVGRLGICLHVMRRERKAAA